MTNSPSSPELGVPCQYRVGEELTLNALRRILQYSDADHQSIERARQYSEGDELTLNALRRILQYSDALKTDKPTI